MLFRSPFSRAFSLYNVLSQVFHTTTNYLKHTPEKLLSIHISSLRKMISSFCVLPPFSFLRDRVVCGFVVAASSFFFSFEVSYSFSFVVVVCLWLLLLILLIDYIFLGVHCVCLLLHWRFPRVHASA